MGNQLTLSADKISAEDFATYLASYEDCIESISASRACKSRPSGMDYREHKAKTATSKAGRQDPGRIGQVPLCRCHSRLFR